MPLEHAARVDLAVAILHSVARSLNKQFSGQFSVEELVSFGSEAVVDVATKYDPTRGVAYQAYARVRLRWAIFDTLRREGGAPRGVAKRLRGLQSADLYVEAKSEEVAQRATNAQQADARLESYLRGVATAYAAGIVSSTKKEHTPMERAELDDPEAEAARNEARELIWKAIDSLGDPDRIILHHFYRLDNDMNTAASHAGVGLAWAYKIHARAIDKLGKRIRELRDGW